MEPIRPTIDIAQDIEIAGTPATVFAALTKDIGGWWGHPFVTARATSLALDPRLGGLFTERWDNGGQVIASVTAWAQDEHLQLTGSFHMGAGVGVATFDLAESATGTLLQFSFRAIGVVDAEVAGAMSFDRCTSGPASVWPPSTWPSPVLAPWCGSRSGRSAWWTPQLPRA